MLTELSLRFTGSAGRVSAKDWTFPDRHRGPGNVRDPFVFEGPWQSLEKSRSLTMGWEAPNFWSLPIECQGVHCLSALNLSRFRPLNRHGELAAPSNSWAELSKRLTLGIPGKPQSGSTQDSDSPVTARFFKKLGLGQRGFSSVSFVLGKTWGMGRGCVIMKGATLELHEQRLSTWLQGF